MVASSRLGLVEYLHRDWKPTLDFETENLAFADCPHILEKLNGGWLKLELIFQSFVRWKTFRPKSHGTNGLGPGIEHELTAFDTQRLKATKAEFVHRRHEAPFRL
jgi:hypothetical protein